MTDEEYGVLVSESYFPLQRIQKEVAKNKNYGLSLDRIILGEDILETLSTFFTETKKRGGYNWEVTLNNIILPYFLMGKVETDKINKERVDILFDYPR